MNFFAPELYLKVNCPVRFGNINENGHKLIRSVSSLALVEAFEHVVGELSRSHSVNLDDVFRVQVVRVQPSVLLTGIPKQDHKLSYVCVVDHL